MCKFFVCVFILFSICGCKTVSVQNKQYKTTTQKITLGSIGISENFALEQTYNHIGFPNYAEALKIQITPIPFNKVTHKAFEQAKGFQPANITVTYIDSIKVKPKFVNIETSDKVTLISLLNNNYNKNIKDYLQNQKNSHIVTNISIALDQKDLEELLLAEEVFIEAIGVKSAGLKAYKEGKLVNTFTFNEGVIFAYRVSSPCWKENDKYQLQIVDLVEGDNGCPNQTYQSAKRAKKKVDYFKF